MTEVLAALIILCPACHVPLVRVEVVEQSAQNCRVEFYACETVACTAGKLAVWFEISGAHVPTEPGFIEREVARRGAFFPSDYTSGSGRRNW